MDLSSCLDFTVETCQCLAEQEGRGRPSNERLIGHPMSGTPAKPPSFETFSQHSGQCVASHEPWETYKPQPLASQDTSPGGAADTDPNARRKDCKRIDGMSCEFLFRNRINQLLKKALALYGAPNHS